MPLRQNMTYMTFVIFHSIRIRAIVSSTQLAVSGAESSSGVTLDSTDA